MNRRLFIISGALSALTLGLVRKANAAPAPATPAEVCLMKAEEISAEATGFGRYQHFHTVSIPVSVLIKPPAAGFKIRSSTLDQGSLDEDAFKAFLKDSGLDESLRFHSHEVAFTTDELNRIASGEKNVKITVLSPKGNFAHEILFTATQSALVKIKRARAVKV